MEKVPCHIFERQNQERASPQSSLQRIESKPQLKTKHLNSSQISYLDLIIIILLLLIITMIMIIITIIIITVIRMSKAYLQISHLDLVAVGEWVGLQVIFQK